MNKTLVFDMDGTIADLYGVDGWLEMLRAEDTTPYKVAEPMYDMEQLNTILEILHQLGWHIVINTWLAMQATDEYKKATRKVKKEWLDRYNFPYDEFHAVQYGTPKHYTTPYENAILFDDSDDVREKWNKGIAVDAKENIIPFLKSLLLTELGIED